MLDFSMVIAAWLWLGLLGATVALADMKNRSVGWLILAYLLCPAAALMIAAFAPMKAK
jgi:dipeptide/tripeptide permease